MTKTLNNIEKYILYATIFLTPIAVAPISPNPYVVSKLIVLVFGIGLAVLVRTIRIIVSGKLELNIGNFDLPIFLIALAYIVSAYLKTPNRMEALLLPGTASLIVLSALTYFLINQMTDKAKAFLTTIVLASGAVFSLIILLARLQVFAQIPQLPAFMQATTFTPTGGYLPAAIFLAVLVPIGIGQLLAEKTSRRKIFIASAVIAIFLGLGLSTYNIIPGRPNSPRFPSFNTSWFIAVDTLKESPLFGVGPGNYLTAFNRFRPLSFNQTDLWAVKYATASDFYITAMTETGLLGAAGIILLLLATYRLIKKDISEKRLVGWGLAGSSSLFSLASIVILLAIFPTTETTILIFFVLFALSAQIKKSSINLSSQRDTANTATFNLSSRIPALIVTLPIAFVTIYIGYQAVGIFKAEYKFRSALAALGRNEGVLAYDTMREAINMNPQVDRYHASYSQVNLALANAIASNATVPEGKITDTDRANIAQLVQQAIREAKSTVALNSLRAGNWQILGRTYQAIMPLATGADTFAIQTYSQAVTLDPTNPNLRITLGGIYYAIGNYETAVRVFELATLAKQDLANSHYNLAFALEQDGKIDRAITELTTVLSLVDRNSQDYELARTALENLQEKKAQLQASAKESGEQLVPPQQAEEQVLQPPLELSQQEEPPEAPITPTPTPPAEGEAGETTIRPQITPTPLP